MIYNISRKTLIGFFRLYNRFSVEGLENLEAGQTYIFAANHSSYVDILVSVASIDRPIIIPFKTNKFPKAIEGLLSRVVHMAPVKNGTLCKASIQAMIDALNRGESCIISPEGTRSKDGQLKKFRDGTTYLALKSGVSVVPMAIINTHKAYPDRGGLPRPRKVKVRFGQPVKWTFSTGDKEEIMRCTAQLHARVADLMEG